MSNPTELPDLAEAVRKLVKAKGRFHTEQNYKELADALARYDARRAQPEGDRDKLLRIIAYTYQIAGAHDCPEHILDVLSDPEAATDEQIESLLPYQPEGEAPQAVYQIRNRTKGGPWQETDADRETCLKRMPQWADLYEFRTLYVAATLSPLCGAQHADSGKERGSIEDYNEFNRLLGNWGQSSWGGSADEIDSTKAYGDLVEYIDAWAYPRAAQLDGGQEGSESNG